MPRLGNRNRLRLREAVRGPFRVTQNAKLSGGQKPCLPLALLGSSE
jgi:hypothetical protein